MFLFNHPPVQRLTSSAVLPFALPYVWPLTSGKNSGHCRWKKSALIMRDTSVDSHHGAALFLGEICAGHAGLKTYVCQLKNGSLQQNHSHVRKNVFRGLVSVYIGLDSLCVLKHSTLCSFSQ